MDIFQIVLILLGVILIYLGISNLRSKSNHTTDLPQFPYERLSPHEYLDTHHREPTSNSNDGGAWRGRDMSHDSHRRADSSDRGNLGGRDTGRSGRK